MSDLRSVLLDRDLQRGAAPEKSSGAWSTDADLPDDEGQSPHRVALARWPIEWRERWGYRANALEDSGMNWRDAEIQAFIEVWNQRRAGPKMDLVSCPLTASEAVN
jgi:hypothetical protein